jgi:hypothetical protein
MPIPAHTIQKIATPVDRTLAKPEEEGDAESCPGLPGSLRRELMLIRREEAQALNDGRALGLMIGAGTFQGVRMNARKKCSSS